MTLDIKGFQKIDLLNYEPYASATIFLSKCNFHCPFCHNPELVLRHDKIKTIPELEIIDILKKRVEWYDGICITGGEPTLHDELPFFIKKIKEMNLLVKMDTNGSNYGMIEQLIKEKVVDYISMDIKAPLEKYDKVTQVKTDIDAIKKSVEIIKNSVIDYAFRTTVIPFYHKEEDMIKIGELLKGSKRFIIQQFRNNRPMLNNSFMKKEKYTLEQLEKFKKILGPYFDEVLIKNT
ncbi:anaerobic ribonucleoside-triphosphate reductase activating protein [Candidatus Woesearchaeota archaeon]|nr:anaerobic ribonucleoside-triphosphate reductase activating protein [Candidatus Woesearchaeota archaeon]